MADLDIEPSDGGVLIRLRVQPKASRNALSIEPDGRIRVAVTAPPVDGEANDALVRFLARQLGMRRHQLTLVSGERSRDKAILVQQTTVEAIENALVANRR